MNLVEFRNYTEEELAMKWADECVVWHNAEIAANASAYSTRYRAKMAQNNHNAKYLCDIHRCYARIDKVNNQIGSMLYNKEIAEQYREYKNS